MAFVMLSIIVFCLETQPGFYTELKLNSSKCKWDTDDTTKMVLVMPINWVTTFQTSGFSYFQNIFRV